MSIESDLTNGLGRRVVAGKVEGYDSPKSPVEAVLAEVEAGKGSTEFFVPGTNLTMSGE